MRHYPKYLVKAEDEFESFNYPQIEQDLDQINTTSYNVPQTLKAEILISFTKHHSLKNEWITANPQFVELVTTGELPIGNIVSLFEASFQNSYFQKQFELYVQQKINYITTTAHYLPADD
jgi:hypothetical protein